MAEGVGSAFTVAMAPETHLHLKVEAGPFRADRADSPIPDSKAALQLSAPFTLPLKPPLQSRAVPH